MVLARIEGVHTVANSQTSQPKGRQHTNAKPEERLDARAALEVLNTAINHCTKAGLTVTFLNEDDRLVLFVKGAYCDPKAKGAKFLPVLAQDGVA